MTTPGILTGGKTQLFSTTVNQPRSPNQGVFGTHPGATPKYAINRGVRDAEYRESLARLFVEIPANTFELFLATVPPETRPLAKVLATGQGTTGTGFIDFLMVQAQESFQERAQVVDTLTDNHVVFYTGMQSSVFGYSGTLLNTYQDDQRVWMLRLYQDILRGSKLANRRLIANLRYDSFLVSGYLEQLSLSLDGSVDNASNFQFSMRVKRLSVITPSLCYPTVAVTPAVSTSVFDIEEESEVTETARAGTVTPEIPPTAVDSPAVDSLGVNSAETAARVRERLQALGWDDESIDGVLAEAVTQEVVGVDSREQQVMASAQGLDRLGTRGLAGDSVWDGVGWVLGRSTAAIGQVTALVSRAVTPWEMGGYAAPTLWSGHRAEGTAWWMGRYAAAAGEVATLGTRVATLVAGGDAPVSAPQETRDYAPDLRNPLNASNDAMGGISNVYGDTTQIAGVTPEIVPVRRSPLTRRRGLLAAAAALSR